MLEGGKPEEVNLALTYSDMATLAWNSSQAVVGLHIVCKQTLGLRRVYL